MIRMDWSENAKIFQCRQEKSAYYHDKQVSINTLVLYQSEGRVSCIGSLSDDTSHKNTAVWASLNVIFTKLNLIDFNDLDHFYIVTDSPSSQYRNKGCAYLTKEFATKHNISITWLFTESGHGKGPMDGVGASIKNAIDEAVIGAESLLLAPQTAKDLNLIINLPNVNICLYDTPEIEQVKEQLPKNFEIKWKNFG